MAEKPNTIFYALANAFGKKKVEEPEKNLLPGSNRPNDFGNIQDRQQSWLDVQSEKTATDLYSRSMYYDSDRITAYNDFRAMDQSPEISVALDIMADECVTRSDRAEILTIYSEDARIKKILKTLFYSKLDVNYNLWFWIRELLKYGDNFLKLELDHKAGITDIIQMPTAEIHKEIGFDGNPKSVRYKWDINGMYFEDFQMAHFSLISDGSKLPYGRSVLDPARKIWKQLQLAEDAMLVYRLVRAPERRMFFIDVGNTEPGDIKQYMQKVKDEIKKSPVVDARTGNVNLKYNPITFEEDYFLPLREGQQGTRIETLPGASNLGDIQDIEYLQNKLFTAIKVPKTYLNYTEGLPGGSTLSQADLRFSRTINRFQEAIVLELRRIANIHLFVLGFQDDLDNFSLSLTNPSTQQELLKLETMKQRNDVFKDMFSSDATSPVSYTWAMEFILGFSKSEIKQILRQKKFERKMFYEIERAHEEYLDTGMFKELDQKFRKPGFDPYQTIDPNAEGGDDGGGDSSGGGGGFSSGGDLGGLDFGADLSGAGDSTDAGFSGGETMDAGGVPPEGTELDTPEQGQEEPEDMANLKEQNRLLENNGMFSSRTKNLLKGIEHYIQKINTEE